MLSVQFIREHTEIIKDSLAKRFDAAPIGEILALDEKRRLLLQEVESLKARRNELSHGVASMTEKPSHLIAEGRQLGDRIKIMDSEIVQIEGRLEPLLLLVPNILHSSVPVGPDESQNVVVRHWGKLQEHPFAPLPHWELGERIGIVDFQRGVKISGSRFYVLKGLGAALERALIDWMIDLHVREHGYVEVATPYLVKRQTMVGTGQLPKFEEDLYRCEPDDLFLIPTAEVPVTNLHGNEILEFGVLPLRYVCYTACFRREAGAAGRDTRGVTRVHQFNKVELVKFVEPQTSYDELELLVADAEAVLQNLAIPYRVSLMCSAEVGFSAAKKYDLEAWSPAENRFIEVSSCSNFEAFQARRANIKYRPAPGAKADYVHTTNGSGLAVGRTLALILDNYQQADGRLVIPEVLHPYLNGRKAIP